MKPWLNVVGIGEDGLGGLSPAARQALDGAELVAGGTRHLDLAAISGARRLAWPRPLEAAFPQILARRGTPVCVLASGDPLYFGVGSTLLKSFSVEEIRFFPGLSSFSLAAARLGWALQDCACLSLHGRSLERLIPPLQPGAHILALSWDQTTPGDVAKLLNQRDFGDTRMSICSCMNGPREDLRSTFAKDFSLSEIDPLNLIALEIPAGTHGRSVPLTAGLHDDWFEHDGQLTRSDMRAITLAALRPHQGELLWDVGAGSGAIGIEWMLRGPSLRALAIEPRQDRAARIRRNALNLGVPDLKIIEGAAPQSLASLPAPDAVFIGGGAGTPGVIEAAWASLKPGGRLVINAVTLQTQSLLERHHSTMGGEMLQINLAHAEPLGRFHGWRPAMPIVQWRIIKDRAGP